MSHPHEQLTAGKQVGSQVTLVTLVGDEDYPAGQDATTTPSSSVTVTPQKKREWHIKTICVTVFIVTLLLISSVLVPFLTFFFLGEVSIIYVML